MLKTKTKIQAALTEKLFEVPTESKTNYIV